MPRVKKETAKGKKNQQKPPTASDIEQANWDYKSTEELWDTVRKLRNDIASLYEIVTALQSEIAELKLKLSSESRKKR